MNISSKQKQELKGLAHLIKPILIIGKDGLTDGVINSIKTGLDKKELIKIKFNSCKDEKLHIIENIKNLCKCNIISIIGNVAILYKQNLDIDKRKILFK